MNKIVDALIIGSITSFTLVTQNAYAACERHIYNKSNIQWSFQAGGKNQAGNVWFYSSTCQETKNSCTLGPNSTAMIKYTTDGGSSSGILKIVAGVANGYNKTFDYAGVNEECPYISHNGGTGQASVNEPADGDISIGPN